MCNLMVDYTPEFKYILDVHVLVVHVWKMFGMPCLDVLLMLMYGIGLCVVLCSYNCKEWLLGILFIYIYLTHIYIYIYIYILFYNQ